MSDQTYAPGDHVYLRAGRARSIARVDRIEDGEKIWLRFENGQIHGPWSAQFLERAQTPGR